MELRSLTDYTNLRFSLNRGNTTIGKEHITEEDKVYLIETFPEWFVKTTEKEEAVLEAEKVVEEEEIVPVHNPFEADPMTARPKAKEAVVENNTDKVEIRNQDPKLKTKKK